MDAAAGCGCSDEFWLAKPALYSIKTTTYKGVAGIVADSRPCCCGSSPANSRALLMSRSTSSSAPIPSARLSYSLDGPLVAEHLCLWNSILHVLCRTGLYRDDDLQAQKNRLPTGLLTPSAA